MPTSKITYLGQLRTRAVHLQSGQEIITDAPVDNKGKGEAFSPTDLLATSLGCCMLTIMGIAALEQNFSIDGTEVEITKIMGTDPRRVSEVAVELKFPPNNYSDRQKAVLKYISENCPVSLSLHSDLKQSVTLNF